MNGQMKVSEARPYKANEIPQVDIDYRGLVNYARSVGKKVPELSDEEKNRFIYSSTAQEIRKMSLK